MDNQEVIKKLSDLYIIQRGNYLIQYSEPVGYRSYIAGSTVNDKKVRPLMDWQIDKHLHGDFTVGTFGGKLMTKFMTWDIDFSKDSCLAKWITYKIADTLNKLGLAEHYISFSGNKGYHVDVFFEDLIQIDHAEKLFKYVLLESEVIPYFDEGNKVEFRPTKPIIGKKQGLGIKLPLGKHQKTGKYCGFCLVEDGLGVMDKDASESYLFSIEKINSQVILDIIGIEQDKSVENESLVKTEEAISKYKELPIYNPTEDYNIDRTIDFLLNGLKIRGSRHNVTLDIAKYFKYMGLDESQCKDELYIWMESQDKNTYTTPLTDCYRDIDLIVKWVYENECSIKPKEKNIAVTLDEIKWIINSCPEKNQKLITYAMLIHSKRFATMQGVFFMTFTQLSEATGLYDQALQSQVNKLIELGTIEAVERNRKQKGTKIKKPNKYRLNIDSSVGAGDLFVTERMNDIDMCLKFYFTDKELKKILPRRQYESIMVG